MAINRNKNSQSLNPSRRKSRYSNNTIFLIGLLALLIGGFVFSNKDVPLFGLEDMKTEGASSKIESVKTENENTGFTKKGELRIIRKGSHEVLYFDIEFLRTSAEQDQLFKEVSTLSDEQAILFEINTTETLAFDAQKAQMPLDLILFDKTRKIIGVYENAKAQPYKPSEMNKEATYLLATKGGYAKANDVKIGDRLVFSVYEYSGGI